MKSKLDSQREFIETSLAGGKPVAGLARELGVHRSTLRDYLAGNGLSRVVASPVLGEPDDVSREDLLEAELKELRRALGKRRKSSVAEERIVLAVEAALETVTPPAVTVQPPATEPDPEAHHRQVLLLSDFHGGEVVDRDGVNGLNSYGWEIQEERVDQLIHGVLSHQKRSPALSGLDVLFLGDMNSGSNHEELTVTNEYNAAEQGVRMGYLLGGILERLAPHVPNVRAGGVVGNHPRLPSKPAAKEVFNNFDWVSYTIARERALSIPNLYGFEIPRGPALLWRVAGRLCYVWHGDGIRSSMPGVPWGGVMRRVNAIQASYPERVDHFFYGHFHQAAIVQGGRIIGNGSLKGPDEWSIKSFGQADPPTQLLLTFDEKRSRMTDVKFLTPTAGL